MHFIPAIFAALAAFETVSAQLIVPGWFDKSCATPTATHTQVVQHVNCRRIVCHKPHRTCSDYEPTGPTARPPQVVKTITPQGLNSCTAIGLAVDNPGCNLCPTCLPRTDVVEKTPITTRTDIIDRMPIVTQWATTLATETTTLADDTWIEINEHIPQMTQITTLATPTTTLADGWVTLH